MFNSDVYGYCFYNDSFMPEPSLAKKVNKKFESQQTMLMKTLSKTRKTKIPERFNGAPCAYFDGVFNYFNINEVAYHAKVTGQKWNGPCVQYIANSG